MCNAEQIRAIHLSSTSIHCCNYALTLCPLCMGSSWAEGARLGLREGDADDCAAAPGDSHQQSSMCGRLTDSDDDDEIEAENQNGLPKHRRSSSAPRDPGPSTANSHGGLGACNLQTGG